MNRIELDNRKKSIKFLKDMGWDAMPMENKAQDGVPDLNAAKGCVELWVEFKIVEEWPKKEKTPIKIQHFTPQQKAWLKLRIPHNPYCYIIIQIEDEHFVFGVTTYVLECLGTTWTKRQIYAHANFVSKDLFEVLDNMQKGIK